MKEVEVQRLEPGRFDSVLEPDQYRRFVHRLEEAADRLAGRRLWHVNSTEEGGGVAEMLHFLLGYLAGAGIDTSWAVLEGTEDFFTLTKRLHHRLHGRPGDGHDVDQVARGLYEQSLKETVAELQRLVGPGDVVFLHDPQAAGLAPELKQLGATVVWSCHVGIDQPNDLARSAWEFLRPYVDAADAYVFSRPTYCWEGLDRERMAVIPPCIDAFAPKNQPMTPPTVSAILQAAGILDAHEGEHPAPTFYCLDGSPGRVVRRAEMIQDAPIPPDVPIVVQVSRWDPLKDPLGVLKGFIGHVPDRLGAHLVLAGPPVTSVSDDPESEQVLQQVRQAAASMPAGARARLHLACIPIDDLEEGGAVVNALQRRADLVVQKSLAEGFGLTVTEAMWKGRPVLASRVGGIQDQITHDRNGLLLDDPSDLTAFGRATASLLADHEQAARLGEEAHRRVRQDYLAPRRLTQELYLIQRLTG